MELSRISSGFYRPRVKRLSNSDLQSIHHGQCVDRIEPESESIIRSSLRRSHPLWINQKNHLITHRNKIVKNKNISVRSFSQTSSFSSRHHPMFISHEDF